MDSSWAIVSASGSVSNLIMTRSAPASSKRLTRSRSGSWPKTDIVMDFGSRPATSASSSMAALPFFTSSGVGYLGDDDSDEFYIRAQLQLLF